MSSASVPDEVLLTTDGDDTIAASFVIAADGHWSSVRRSLERDDGSTATSDLGEWHAARQYFANAGDDRLWVFFEPDLLSGYFWIFPLPNGYANVGYGVLRSQGRTGKQLKALWPALLDRPHIREVLGTNAKAIGTVKAWPIPTRYEPATLSDRRVLYVGDAARIVDPMTGEGIAQALETGGLAATAVAHMRHAANAHDAVGARYRSLVHHELGRDLKFAARLQPILSRNIGAEAALRIVNSNDWTRRNFARWMFEDYPRAVLFTPDRWHRSMFSTHGGFAP